MVASATSYEARVHRLVDRLAGELLVFWRNDRVDVLAMPDQALRLLIADYLLHRDAYLARYPSAAYAISAMDDAETDHADA